MTNVEPDDINSEICDTKLRDELRSCQQLLVDSELERARHKVFNHAEENPVSEKLDDFSNNLKCAAKTGFWVHFEKPRRWRIQIILRTRKQYPAGPIESRMHQGRHGKAKRYSQQN